jgi:hypothetical protein
VRLIGFGSQRASEVEGTMPQYRMGATEDDYLRLKAGMTKLAAGGPFDANEAFLYAVRHGLTINAGDVAAVLGNMADQGELRRAGPTGLDGPERFELPR